MSMFFEEIKKDTLYIAVEIVNSNPEFNVFENGKETRNLENLEDEFLNQNTISAFIKLDDTYIGVIDFMLEHPNDHFPWLGLLMIHGDYQGYGFGAQAYALFEKEMLKRGLDTVRIGVIQENKKAQHFWESQGFVYYQTTLSKSGSRISCYQKSIG